VVRLAILLEICRLPERCFEGNIATNIKEEKKEEAPNSEEEWDIEAGFS
jgi:hypothetical protein